MASSETGKASTPTPPAPTGSRSTAPSQRAETPPATEANGSARLGAADAATKALTSVSQLTGKAAEGVTGIEPTKNGWIIAVEVVEDRHVPSSADILATYEAELGADGTLLAYQRTRRYARGRADGGRVRS